MIEELFIVGRYAVLACLILNVLFFLVFHKKIHNDVKAVGAYLLLNIITELYSEWLYHKELKSLFLLHIYTLFEFITWSYFYRQLFKNKLRFQKVSPVFIATTSILIIANTIFFEPISGFNSNAKTLVQLILIGYAIYYFFASFGKVDLTKPLPRSISLINFAVILYYSGSLFIFMFSKLLANNNVPYSHQHGFWAVNALLNLIFQVLIFISLWTVAFQKTKS